MNGAKARKIACLIGFNLLLFSLFAELALRLLPGVIPLTALAYFTRPNQSRIAKARHLPNRIDSRLVDDGRPQPLIQQAPFTVLGSENVDLDQRFTVRLDRFGFCNPASVNTLKPSQFEVVVLGDSFTYCTTVAAEGTWPALLTRSTGHVFYNMGLFGHGPEDHLRLLAHHRAAMTPRVVVMAYYAGNDLRDSHRYQPQFFDRPPGPKYEQGAAPGGGSDNASLISSSYLVSMARFLAAGGGRDPGAEGQAEAGGKAAARPGKKANFRYGWTDASGMRHRFNLLNADRGEVTYARMVQRHPRALLALDSWLDRFQQDATTHHYIPVVVFLPSAYYVLPGVSFEDAAVGRQVMAFTRAQEKALADGTRRRGMRYVDLSPDLRAAMASTASPRDLLYNPTNRHLSPRGNQEVARVLAGRLVPLLR